MTLQVSELLTNLLKIFRLPLLILNLIMVSSKYFFNTYLTRQHFYGFVLLHPAIYFFLYNGEMNSLYLYISVFFFLLYYGFFFLATCVNVYAIISIVSFSYVGVSNFNDFFNIINKQYFFNAHPFSLMLILPLLYIFLLIATQSNKYNLNAYKLINYNSIQLFKFLLLNFMLTYGLIFLYIIMYKFSHIFLSYDVLLQTQFQFYAWEKQSYCEILISYDNVKNLFSFFPLPLIFYFDTLGIFFIGLSLLLMYLSFLFLWPTFYVDKNKTLYITQLLLLLTQLQGTFTAASLLGFFIFFESLLIPMLIMIAIWGSKNNRQASNYLIFYTMFSAVPMFLAILYIQQKTGLQTIPDLYTYITCSTNNQITWTWMEQLFLWLSFFIGFAVKTPMVPFHIWLPKAHVDAPTVGSVILAGLLLKVGLVGFIRILYLLFPLATQFFSPYVAALATVGVIYASLITLRQIDMKRIIAYSSVAHMNMAMVSLCSLNPLGVYSSIYLMLSHGLIASGLFFLVGFLYNRFHVRSVYYYGGLATIMPVMSFFFFLFTLANMAFPLTSGFIGEFLLLLGISVNNFYIAFLNAFSMLLTTVYSVLLFGRVFLGELKPWFQNLVQKVVENTTPIAYKQTWLQYLKVIFFLHPNLTLLEGKKIWQNTNFIFKYWSNNLKRWLLIETKSFSYQNSPLFKSISFYDIYYYELVIVLILWVFIVFLGIYPQIIFAALQKSAVLNLIINTFV